MEEPKLFKEREHDRSQLNRLKPLEQAPGLKALSIGWPLRGAEAPLFHPARQRRAMLRVNFMVKPNGRLVFVSSSHYWPYTPNLSNRWSSCALLIPYGLGDLILRSTSRLYAFSVYYNRTSLPSHAADATTGTQEVRPSRSSRTKDRPSQISYAHGR